MPALTVWEDELLSLPLLQPEQIRDTLHAYQLAKRCNEKRVMAEAVKWGKRGARLNGIAPGVRVRQMRLPMSQNCLWAAKALLLPVLRSSLTAAPQPAIFTAL